MSHEYLVIYEPLASERNWGAWVSDLPGCIAVADTLDECKTLIAEAIAIHLKGMDEDGDPIPPPSAQAGLVRVAV